MTMIESDLHQLCVCVCQLHACVHIPIARSVCNLNERLLDECRVIYSFRQVIEAAHNLVSAENHAYAKVCQLSVAWESLAHAATYTI